MCNHPTLNTLIDYPTGTGTTFAFDNADREIIMVDASGTTTYGLDNADQLTSLTTPQGNLTYSYNNASWLRSHAFKSP